MGLIDVILLAILALGFISGLQKGFITSLLACGAMVLAWFIALGTFASVSGMLADSNLNDWLNATQELENGSWEAIFDSVSFAFVFFIAYAALLLFVNLLNNMFRMPKLRGVDSLFGGLLGIARAAVILLAIIAVIKLTFSPINETLVQNTLNDSVCGEFLNQFNIFNIAGL